MTTQNLLLELFVEELPPKALKKLGDAFAATISASLQTQGLATADAPVTAYASPRRLAVRVADVLACAADKPVSQKLMPVSVGLDADGQPTPALLKRLAALGADASAVPQLKRAQDGKNEALFFDSVAKGVALAEGLQIALEEALAKLPIPKVMTYQLEDGWSSVNFVRPAHGLVALRGSEIVPVSVLGLHAGRQTHGHRFEAASDKVVLRDADSYAQQLAEEGAVIASFAERRADIEAQLSARAAELGLRPVEDEALLDEVTALVERPNVLVGQFEDDFLAVPQECLILTMKANQKYFPLLDAAGKLTNRFLIVSNIRPADPRQVIGGNERVVRPRLADARFFFDQDRKKSLESRVLDLSRVVYHNKLGSQGDRVQRVCAIAQAIGRQLGGDDLALQAEQAALLSKADLLTDMVGEFPELQGIMGRYYALHDGLDEAIAYAIEDHYKPRFAGDVLPRNEVGLCVALADKLETLVGLFGIGQMPTGDKDPFALRRHALGVIRMLSEAALPLELESLLGACCTIMDGMLEEQQAGGGEALNLDPVDAPVLASLMAFFYDRLSASLREQGYSALEVDAVLALSPQRLGDVSLRLAAVRSFVALPEAEALAAANKRVGNILKKADSVASDLVDPALFQEDAERALHQALQRIAPEAGAAFLSGDFTASLCVLAALRAPVDAFFDQVMVNAEDAQLRANRLALLEELHHAMNQVADLSRLVN